MTVLQTIISAKQIKARQTKMWKYNVFHNYQLISADATLYSSLRLPIHHVNVIFSQVFNQTLSDEEGKVITAILNFLLSLHSLTISRSLPNSWCLPAPPRVILFIGWGRCDSPSVVHMQDIRKRSKQNFLATSTVNWPQTRSSAEKAVFNPTHYSLRNAEKSHTISFVK